MTTTKPKRKPRRRMKRSRPKKAVTARQRKPQPTYGGIFENLSFAFIMGHLAKLLMPFAAGRKAIANHSIMFFAWYYLGITLTLHQARWARKMVKSKRFLTIAPRGHGKSELLSYIMPLWVITRNRNIRILIITLSDDLARKHVIRVREQLEKNVKLIRDYGDFYHIKRVAMWRQDAFSVIRDGDMKDPTLEGVGVEGRITGSHYDIIIPDDLIDEDSVNTAEQIAKTLKKMTGTIIPLLEDKDGHVGQIWAVGTRKHFNDIYNWMIDNPMYEVLVEPAIIEWPKDYRIEQLDTPIEMPDGTLQHFVVHISEDDPGRVLWPERYPMDKLILIRHEIGSIMFAREYQGEPQDDETALFKRGWLEGCRQDSMSYVIHDVPQALRADYELIVIGADLSLVTDKKAAEKGDTDYMVQVAIGLRKNLITRDLLAIDRVRGLSPNDKELRLNTFYQRILPYKCAIEDNAFAIIHIHNLLAQTDMKILKHHTGKTNKNDPAEGIPHLSALIETGRLRLPNKSAYDKEQTQTLIDELHSYPIGAHDDQVLALWITEYTILRWLRAQARIRRLRHKARRSTEAA